MYSFEKIWVVNVRHNGISDDKCFINYGDILKRFQNLDQYFTSQNPAITQCAFLEVNNTVNSVILLLYLLSKKINLFIASPNLLNSGVIPAFCDKIIMLDEKLSGDSIRIQVGENSNYVKRKSFETSSAMVILASSGSTATPKYIYYKKEKLFKNAAASIPHFKISKDVKLLISVPVCHMYGLGAGLLPAILSGANVTIINNANVIKLKDKLSTFNPDLSLINPALCKMLLQTSKVISKRRNYLSAGEPLDAQIENEFKDKFGHLINLYGCSELGAMATSAVSALEKTSSDKRLLKPVNGVVFKIRTTGNSNELLCKNQHSFEYYLDEYGKKMADQPFEDGWYRTKDAGRIEHDGRLEILGRIDLCINRSGFLLSLEDLEAKLENLLIAINKVVALETGSKALVAICELKPDQSLDASDAKSVCFKNLPRYAIPDQFHFIESIPRLYNGKVDRKHISFLYK